jgi:uncharacterized protein YciI
MLFVIIAKDKPDSLPLRMSTRAAHLEYVKATGAVRLAGPFLDPKGEMSGSLIIIEAADLNAAKEWQANDPYVKAGLFQSAQVEAWKATANFCNATL